MISSYNSVIKISRYLSLFFFIESMVSRIVLEFVRYNQSMVSLLKILYLIELSSYYMTNFVTNVKVYG